MMKEEIKIRRKKLKRNENGLILRKVDIYF